jgi:hypothetical protein
MDNLCQIFQMIFTLTFDKNCYYLIRLFLWWRRSKVSEEGGVDSVFLFGGGEFDKFSFHLLCSTVFISLSGIIVKKSQYSGCINLYCYSIKVLDL